MKKRAIAILLAGLMCFSAAACGNENTVEDDEPVQEEEKEVEEKEEEEKPEKEEVVEAEPEPTEPEVKEPEYDEYAITKIITPFSDGKAWVNYKDDNNEYSGLINTDGILLYSFEKANDNQTFNDFGSTYIGNDKEYVILDDDGKESAHLTNTDNDKFSILGACGGKYIVEERVQTFSEDKHIVYLINESGEKISDEFDIVGGSPKTIMLSKDVYVVASRGTYPEEPTSVFFNLSDDGCYAVDMDLKENLYGFGTKSDGYAVMTAGERLQIFTPEDYAGKEAFEECASGAKGNYVNGTNVYGTYFYGTWGRLSVVSEGQYIDYWPLQSFKYNICDIAGNIVFEGEFPEGTRIYYVSPYSGGIALIFVEGYDGMYVTAVDKDGNSLYEPVKVECTIPQAGFDDEKFNDNQCNGYFILTNGILTPSGDILPLDGDLSEIPDDVRIVNNRTSLSEGYIVTNGSNAFRSLDGSVTIEQVRVEKE